LLRRKIRIWNNNSIRYFHVPVILTKNFRAEPHRKKRKTGKMKEEEKSTSPKYEGNERTQELLGDGLRLCKLASFYQRNHILVRSSSC
jgi:hypothetical protein